VSAKEEVRRRFSDPGRREEEEEVEVEGGGAGGLEIAQRMSMVRTH